MNYDEKGAVQMKLITRSAQRAIAGLSLESRRRVCQALVKPVPRQNCTRLHGTVLPNVWHFRVSDTLRITFVYRKNQRSLPCVVHAGRHKAMERFLTVWDGGVTHVSEIEEFAMKEKHVNGKQSKKSRLITTQDEVSASNEDELLVQALRAIRRGNSENLETLLELHFEPISRAVTRQLGEIECCGGRLEKLQKSVADTLNRTKAVTLDIALLNDTHSHIAERVEHMESRIVDDNRTLRLAVGQCTSATKDRLDQLEANLSRPLGGISDAVNDLLVRTGQLRNELSELAHPKRCRRPWSIASVHFSLGHLSRLYEFGMRSTAQSMRRGFEHVRRIWNRVRLH